MTRPPYREDDAARAEATEAEARGDVGGEIGDGSELRAEEEPAAPEAFIPLRTSEKAAVLEHQTQPHRSGRVRRRPRHWSGGSEEGSGFFFASSFSSSFDRAWGGSGRLGRPDGNGFFSTIFYRKLFIGLRAGKFN